MRREGAADVLQPREQPLERLRVDLQPGLGDLRAAVADRAIDLAAAHFAREVLAQLALGGAQLIRQAEAGLEKAVIDAAQLAYERPPGSRRSPAARSPSCWRSLLNATLPAFRGDIKADRKSNRCTDLFLRVEYADVSLLGGREENQDRVAAAVADHAALLVVVDGMGGHANGARAAEITREIVLDAFGHTLAAAVRSAGIPPPGAGRAHEEVVKLGASLPLEQRPRATCALCLVQQGASWWAHVGDSRIYHLRAGTLVGRSRDHSHVEVLLREGLITAEQALTHPHRNYVECCLGGDPILPDMAIRGGAHCSLETCCCSAPMVCGAA